jgi:uncharacterized protein YcbK (DUF882 family)
MAFVLALVVALCSILGDAARTFFAPAEPSPTSTDFVFQNRRQEQRFELQLPDGSIDPAELRELSHFVRCWRTDREKSMHPRVVEIVATAARHFGGATVEVISGYRAKPYGAPRSKHFIGRAMDVHLRGVRAKQVAAWVWKNFRGVGVGYYPRQQFVHIDVRDHDVLWVDKTPRGESKVAHYLGRPASEELPIDAPVLAYDRGRARGMTIAAR